MKFSLFLAQFKKYFILSQTLFRSGSPGILNSSKIHSEKIKDRIQGAMTGENVNGAANGAASIEPFVPQNVLITGGAGFIASHVAIRLTKNYGQYKVRFKIKIRKVFHTTLPQMNHWTTPAPAVLLLD